MRDGRFLNMLRPQIGEIHDLNFGPPKGTFFTKQGPLSLEERFRDTGPRKNIS